MNIVGTFLLFVTAVVGTLLLIFSPIRRLTKSMEGKTQSEINADLSSWLKSTSPSSFAGKGCFIASSIALSLIYGFVIEPIAVLSAILREIGYQPLAYAMLLVVLVWWFETIKAFTHRKKKEPEVEIIDSKGAITKGEIVNYEEPFSSGDPIKLKLRRIFYSLPTVYLWYMFLVAIRVLN